MSMSGSPSRLRDPIMARDCSVIRSCIALLISSVTSTSAPANSTFGDLADVDARDAHDGAALEPLHVGERVFSA
jgi:hypothetical protein